MSDYRGICVVCGEPVRGAAAREVEHAWEVERAGGGTHAVQGPAKRHSGRVMHPVCHGEQLSRERRGVLDGQEALL